MTYLALYTGPGGPISHTFDASGQDTAREHVAAHGRAWVDAASDVLDIDPDSATLTDDIDAALAAGGWVLVESAQSDDQYSLYERSAHPTIAARDQLVRELQAAHNGRSTYASWINEMELTQEGALRGEFALGNVQTLIQVLAERRPGWACTRAGRDGRVLYITTDAAQSAAPTPDRQPRLGGLIASRLVALSDGSEGSAGHRPEKVTISCLVSSTSPL